jgi:hypothetical protein
MFKVLLIGSGQIGSRHLQGLAKLKINSSINVIEPSKNSQLLAKKRLKEVKRSENVQSINFYEHIHSGLVSADLVIVATSSDVRKNLVEDLLRYQSPDYMILEKFAFQSKDDYLSVLDLLKKKKVECYVNCPNRAFESYKKLKAIFEKDKKMSIEVDGGDWHLASNLIHYLDIVNYLTESKISSLNGESLSKRILNSKRKGYKEFSGIVTGLTERGDTFTIRHRKNSSKELSLIFSSENNQIKVLESHSKAIINFDMKGQESEMIDFPILNQSDLTTELVHDIFFENKSSLIDIKDSYHIHALIIELFIDHLKKVEGKVYKKSPIT